MDDPRIAPERVDEFILAVAAQLRIAGPKSQEAAIAAAVLALADRLHRDFGPADIGRLAARMEDEGLQGYRAALLRAQYALPIDRVKREVHWRSE